VAVAELIVVQGYPVTKMRFDTAYTPEVFERPILSLTAFADVVLVLSSPRPSKALHFAPCF